MVLILVHEFGHFIVAKAFGIRVDEFGIGFPPRLLAFKKGETTYTINALLFGGFVRIFGENPGEGKSDPRSFSTKSRWAQATVLMAGITFNFLFAWLALSAGYMIGMPISADHAGFGTVTGIHTTIVDVQAGSPADKAGVKPEDVIEQVKTGTATLLVGSNADAVQEFILAHQDESILLTVMRNGQEKTLLAKPIEGITPGYKAIGIALGDIGILQLPPHLALLQGGMLSWKMTTSIANGLLGLMSNLVRGTGSWDGVLGPIGIAGMGATAVAHGAIATIILASLISINLAIINLLPIPGLDGGRLLIVIVEGIIKKPLGERFSTWITLAGFTLLIGLMLAVSVHDIFGLVR